MRYVRYALLTVAVVGLVGSLGYIVYTPPMPPTPEAFASLVAERFDGTEMSFEELAGNILIIDFWATWCGPCIAEIPHYNALDNDYRDKGVSLIGLTVESGTPEEVLEWMASDEKHNITYPLVMSNDEMLNVFGPVFGFPTTLLIDTEGNVVKRWIGASKGKSDQIREFLDKLLAGEQLEGLPSWSPGAEEVSPLAERSSSLRLVP